MAATTGSRKLIGLDIGGTKCAVILGDASQDPPAILERVSFPTETAKGPEHALVHLEAAIRELLTKHSLTTGDVAGIGISCGGPLDSRKGLVLSPPNLPGWDNIPIVERFRNAFGIPARLQNDANACALAEWRWGAGRGTRNMVFLTFGTGMGAGLILDGRLYSGTNDLGGEVGHLRLAEDGPEGYGKRGSFEGFCSGGGIARLSAGMIRQAWADAQTVGFCPDEHGLANLSTRQIADAANAGDPLAVEIFQIVARRLGQGLSLLIDILNPEMIVIGSIFIRQRHLLWPLAKEVIDREALPAAAARCRIVPAALGEAIGDYASLSVAVE